MLCVAAFGFSVHTLRRRYKAVDRWYMQQFGPILRPHERHALPGTSGPAHACWHVHSSYHVHSVCDIGPGAFWFLLGCAAVTAMYAKPIAMLAILFLSFGDPAASAAGVTFGDRYSTRLPFAPRKSLVGLMAASVACGVVVSLYSAVLPDLGLSALPLSTRVCQLRELIQWPLRVYTNAFDMVVRLRVM